MGTGQKTENMSASRVSREQRKGTSWSRQQTSEKRSGIWAENKDETWTRFGVTAGAGSWESNVWVIKQNCGKP